MPALVGRSQTSGDLHRKLDRAFRWHALARDCGMQAVTVEQLGHDERPALVLADVVDGQDVRMIERSRGSRLMLETSQTVGIATHRVG